MTHGALIALCENRINGLSRTRLAFEQSITPERVGRLVEDLRTAASGWDEVVSIPPDGDPVVLRVGARSVREGVPGFAAVGDVLDAYAAALEAGQVRHASGLADVRAARGAAAALPDGASAVAEATAQAAIAVLDRACTGYAACQDAYQAVRDAELALYAALHHVRVRPPGSRGHLRV